MPARFDRHIGSIEILEPVRTDEGFLKMHGIAARTGVLYYQDEDGKVSGELIPPEELFAEDSLASLGGKPLTDNHPRDKDGNAVLVTPDNSEAFTRGTIGNEIKGDRSTGFVRITIDAHQADIISKIEGGKRQLSSGRTIGRLDATPGVWDANTQTYWLGSEASGKPGVKFDKVQRVLRHNHIAVVDRGRAGKRVAIKMDSGDAVQVEPPNNGGLPMAKVRIDGAEYEVDSGAAAAITRHLEATRVKADEQADALKTVKADKVRLTAERDAAKKAVEEATAKLDGIDPKAMVQARLALERSVAALKMDGIDEMTDREIMVAAIKTIKADYDDTDVSDEHVGVYFDAMISMGAVKAAPANDGRGGLRGSRMDSAPAAKRDERLDAYMNRGSYKNRLKAQRGDK